MRGSPRSRAGRRRRSAERWARALDPSIVGLQRSFGVGDGVNSRVERICHHAEVITDELSDLGLALGLRGAFGLLVDFLDEPECERPDRFEVRDLLANLLHHKLEHLLSGVLQKYAVEVGF